MLLLLLYLCSLVLCTICYPLEISFVNQQANDKMENDTNMFQWMDNEYRENPQSSKLKMHTSKKISIVYFLFSYLILHTWLWSVECGVCTKVNKYLCVCVCVCVLHSISFLSFFLISWICIIRVFIIIAVIVKVDDDDDDDVNLRLLPFCAIRRYFSSFFMHSLMHVLCTMYYVFHYYFIFYFILFHNNIWNQTIEEDSWDIMWDVVSK